MGDTISKQAVITEINSMPTITDENGEKLIDKTCLKIKIKAIPLAQSRWIPVTKRLPTENSSYLVWMPFTPEGHHITVAEWCGSYWNIKTPITAWMPLPAPCIPEGDDKHEG